MRNIKDQRFGRLVAIERLPGSKWLCRCDCGNEKVIQMSNLIYGMTKSCGCLQKNEISNQRFGRLTVINRVTGKTWLCRCDCGNEKIVSTKCLINGDTRSCGCIRKGSHYKNISGQRFGRLIALNPTREIKYTSMVWQFKCDCGKLFETTVDSVKKGHCKSCGCLMSEMGIKNAQNMREHCEIVDGTNVNNIVSKKIYINNKSGIKGVNWHKTDQKWIARIQFQGKKYHLGYFHNIEDAAKARVEAEERLHGPFLEWYENNLKNTKKKTE